MSILGLDIGTTGVKAVAFNEEGKLLVTAYREYHLKSPREGHLELDPGEVLQAVREVLGEASEATRTDPIRSMATSTLGEAAVPVDGNNKPLGNAIIGFDARGQEEVDQLREKLSDEEVFDITGHGINAFHTLFKVMWYKRHRGDVYKAAKNFLCFGDFVAASLGLPPRIDYSMAARTLALNIHQKSWSEPILEAAGIRDIFCSPIAPGEVVGEVGSNDLGLPRGCIVAGGLHDQSAGMLGAGILPGEAMLATGTVVCLGVCLTSQPSKGPMIANNLCFYPTFGENQWTSLAFNFTGGSILKWFRDEFAFAECAEAEKLKIDPYEVICGNLPEQPTGLLVLPHFATSGTPFIDPKAMGALLGLRLTTSRHEIAKALLEGLAFEILLNAELLDSAAIPIERYKAIGGAAKSPIWMQLYADMLNRPVIQLELTEGAGLGAALLGAHAVGICKSREDMDRVIRNSAKEKRIYEPRESHNVLYKQKFSTYKELYPATRDITHQLFDQQN